MTPLETVAIKIKTTTDCAAMLTTHQTISISIGYLQYSSSITNRIPSCHFTKRHNICYTVSTILFSAVLDNFISTVIGTFWP